VRSEASEEQPLRLGEKRNKTNRSIRSLARHSVQVKMPLHYFQLPYDMKLEPRGRRSIDPLVGAGDDYEVLGSDSSSDNAAGRRTPPRCEEDNKV